MADTQTGETETVLEVTDNSWYYYMLIDLEKYSNFSYGQVSVKCKWLDVIERENFLYVGLVVI